MKTSVFLPLVAAFLMSDLLCSGMQSKTDPPPSLVGTWRLVSYNDPSNEWRSYPENVIYEKYITPTHFLWVRYEKDNDQLVGMGGGTYSYDGENYQEKIEFFLPATSGILGQTIDFTARFDNGKWHHTGYARETVFDPGEAATVMADSARIEEIWEQVPASVANENDLMGVWRMVSYKEKEDGPAMSYPGFVKYLKLVTPTHFAWVQYNEDGDYISGAGAGTYTYNGEQYIENVNLIYPAGSELTGSKITFDCELRGNLWLHSVSEVEKDGEKLDSVYIDERWVRYRGR